MRLPLPGSNAILAATAIVLALTLWPAVYSSWSAGHDLGFSWRVLLFSCLFIGSALAWGLLPTSLVASAARIWDFALAVVVGSCLVSATLMVVSFLLPVAAWKILLFLLVSGGILILAATRRCPEFLDSLRTVSPACLLAICVSLFAASAWSQGHLFAFEKVGSAVVYRPWLDGFELARFAALFSLDLQPQTLGHPLSGLAPNLYHHGPYAAAGAFSGFTQAPSLSAIDAFLFPWGVFLMGMAAYALGKYWWGEGGGLASLTVALLLPDASFYGLQVSWFGYHWLQQTSPSLSWGVAVGACSILLVDAACRRADRTLLLLGLSLALASVLFKAQIAAILVPTLSLWGVVAFSGIRIRVRLAMAGLTTAALAVLAVAVSHLSSAPSITLGHNWGLTYLEFVASGLRSESVRELWQQVTASEWVALRVPLLLLASFGALPFVYLTTVMIRGARRQSTVSDLLPLSFLIVHLAMVLGLARSTVGNAYELQHRPFVFVYFLLAVWCGGSVVSLLRGRSDTLSRSRLTTLAILPLLAFPVFLGDEVLGERVWFSPAFLSTSLPQDHLACIDFIREHSAPTEIVQASDNDPNGITAGLTERRGYLSRPALLLKLDEFSTLVQERFEDLTDFRCAATMPAFSDLIDQLGIRWYLLKPWSEVSWPPAVVSAPAFRSGNYQVYDLDVWRRGSGAGAGEPGPAAPYRRSDGPGRKKASRERDSRGCAVDSYFIRREASDPYDEVIVSAGGETIRIVPGALDGVVDSVQRRRGHTWLSGWASDGAHRKPARKVTVFADGRSSSQGHITVLRRGLASRFKAPALERAGFGVFLPRSLFDKDPPPRVRVFAISSAGVASELHYRPEYDDGAQKRRLGNSSGGEIEYSLVNSEASSGLNESIVSTNGERIKIIPGALDGHVDSLLRLGDRAWLMGWASDEAHRYPAVTVAVFVESEASHQRHTTVPRLDVAKAFKTAALADAGFKVPVPASIFDRLPPPVVRVFAISSAGVASELHYRPKYDYGEGKRQLGNWGEGTDH